MVRRVGALPLTALKTGLQWVAEVRWEVDQEAAAAADRNELAVMGAVCGCYTQPSEQKGRPLAWEGLG